MFPLGSAPGTVFDLFAAARWIEENSGDSGRPVGPTSRLPLADPRCFQAISFRAPLSPPPFRSVFQEPIHVRGKAYARP